MVAAYTKLARCQEHPHRVTERRCDRCRKAYCDDCLIPGPREADGTRPWRCATCTAAVQEAAEEAARARTIEARVTRAAHTGRNLLLALGGTAAIGLTLFFGFRWVNRTQAAVGAPAPAPGLEAQCGELSRIRSVGAIGVQGADDAVNVLAYPQRAFVSVLGAASSPGLSLALPTGAPATASSPGGPGGPGAADAPAGKANPLGLVDECATGYQQASQTQLPVTFVFDTQRTGTYIQRISLRQDPTAPRSTWPIEFELLASPSPDGDDFVPLLLDRPAKLQESVEPQWFSIMRPGPNAAASPFPDVAPMRRMMVRVLSTIGSPRTRSVADGVSLGEVSAYGPDLEVLIDGDESGGFGVGPREIKALAGEPKFVFFMNRTTTAVTHTIVTVNQQQNLSVRLGPGEARAGMFIAGRPGRYEFYCNVVGHAQFGLIGTLTVR